MLLERYQILRFNGIYFISFECKMWDTLKIEIFLSLKIQQKNPKYQGKLDFKESRCNAKRIGSKI
jgi:hypothetical protein